MKKIVLFISMLSLLGIISGCRKEDVSKQSHLYTYRSIELTNGSPEIDIAYLETVTMPKDTYECIIHNSEYNSHLLLSPILPVTDFRVVLLEYIESDDTKIRFRITKELFTKESLAPDKPLILHTELPETIPYAGIVYENRKGETKLYTLNVSGLDGTPLLIEASF